MNPTEKLLQYILTGICQGSIYAMVALGFTIIYNATSIINLAQGEFVMLGGMLAITLTMTFNLPLWQSFIVSVTIVFLIGGLLYALAILPMRKPNPIKIIIITIGLSIFIKGVAMLIWGTENHTLTSFSGDEPIKFGNVTISPQHLWILAVLLISVLILNFFYSRTITGKAMRACSSNPKAASLMGIDVRRMTFLTWAFSGALGAAAGIVITPLTMMGYHMGTMIGLKGFSAAVLGGLGSNTGSIAGGILVGILENLGAGYISSSLKDAIAFMVMLIVLFFKPSGILGAGKIERV